MRKYLILFAALIAASRNTNPAYAGTYSPSPATVAASLSAVQPGDTVVLGPVNYGTIAVPARSWKPPITIDARLATYRLTTNGTAGVRILAGATANNTTVNSSLGYGYWIKNSSRIGIENPTLKNNRINVYFDNAKDSYAHGVKCTGQLSDCVDVFWSNNVDVGYTTCTVPGTGVGQHPDCVQLALRYGRPTTNINVHDTYAKGDFQCVNAFSHNRPTGNDGPFHNLTYRRNVCIGLYAQGITAANVIGGIFEDNIAYTSVNPKATYAVRYQLYGCMNCTSLRNVTGDRPGALPVKPEPLPPVIPAAVDPALLKMIGF